MRADKDVGTSGTLPINTKTMNAGMRAALEVAEAARDTGDKTDGFAAQLAFGRFRRELVSPFPAQTDEDRAIGDDLVARVIDYLRHNLDAEEVDAERSIPESVMRGLHKLGMFRMKVPTEYGGLGLSQVNYNRVILAVASHCGSTAVLISAHQSIGVPTPLKMFGTPEQKKEYLTRIAKGALSAFALTEPDVGSDPAKMTTTATPIEDGWAYEITGVKQWCTNGPIADLIVVMANTVDESGKSRITAFIVEGDAPGIEHVHRCDFMGLRAIQNGIIRFNKVRVPKENIILGEGKGLKLALKTLNTGRLTLPAACAGMGKQCVSIARRWGAQRVQWGHPIGEHEAGAQKIAEIASSTFAMESIAWLTSHWADQGRDIRMDAAMAKLFCSETAWRVIDQTMQLRGGRGYERADSLLARGEAPFPVERMMRDCRINTIIEGTSDIMRLFLAREALDPHLKIAGGVLDPRSSIAKKIASAGTAAIFYARWYPARLIRSRIGPMHRGHGKLSTHYRFIDRASNRMAATLFAKMVRYGPKLERKQIVLGALMDAATELFAMAATCAHAEHLSASNSTNGKASDLADVFCLAARRRVLDSLATAKRNDQPVSNRLSKRVLAGDFGWLEQGIIPADDAPNEDLLHGNGRARRRGLFRRIKHADTVTGTRERPMP